MSRRWLILALVGAVALAGLLTLRAVKQAHNWQPPEAMANAPLEGWMTLRLIAHAHGTEPERLALALGYDPDTPPRRKTLEQIAEDRGMALDQVIATLDAALGRDR